MFRLFPEHYDEVLDVAALPATDRTEMNYRTKPLSDSEERRLVALFMLVPVPLVLLTSFAFRFVVELSPWLDDFLLSVGIVSSVWFAYRRLSGSFVRWEVIAASVYCVGMAGATIWKWQSLLGNYSAYFTLIITWLLTRLIVRQTAAWICAGPAVDFQTLKRWSHSIPDHGLLQYSRDCRELITFSASPAIILGGVWMAGQVSKFAFETSQLWAVMLVPCVIAIWLVWHVGIIAISGWPNATQSVLASCRAIRLFLTYDPYQIEAAGVFRFPTRLLRAPIHRWIASVSVLVVIGFGVVVSLPSPWQSAAHPGQVMAYTAANFILAGLLSPILLLTILWVTGGTVLSRFDQALNETEFDSVNEWDNYVDRIVNSEDELEREHLLMGVCENGDFPVLVHRDIFDQHCHILGDSGASKTALGIAPQATQLIARADSTVVVVDLKGDKALFEGCRREAARAGLRFRWISNEVGSTSFAFNPFVQSHNDRLSVEQLTQQLLQGLSLDYGIQYGAGYFTAMNEIVLSSVMQETGARSFQELSDHLGDKKWYSKIGNAEDWAQARHLGSLVKRLAGSAAINVVPGSHLDNAAVDENAIDAAELYEEPQVVYLWLRSAVESTNAPTIARLFLWSMFTAASHHPQDDNRVYFFMDEFQQVISDGIKLVFEQFRDLGGTMIAAHQTASQLKRQGTDLGETIDSCTAVKQVFRASDLYSLERLEKLSGTKRESVPTWYQPFERGLGELRDRYDPTLANDGVIRVSEEEKVRYTKDDLLAISSRKTSSLVRFTFGSGYTQFAGATIPVTSQFHIDFDEYKRRRQQPWPTAEGAFEVKKPEPSASESAKPIGESNEAADKAAELDGFAEEFERRSKQLVSG